MNRVVEVVKVIRDEFGSAIWVRLQYFKEGELLHDVVFLPNSHRGVWVQKRIKGDFVPENRYFTMAKKAAAILCEKRPSH